MTLQHLVRLPALAVLSLSGLSAAAHASTITAGTYTLTNAYVAGYSVTGTVSVSSSSVVTSTNLVFNNASFNNPGLPTFNQVSSTGAYNGLSQNYLTSSSNIGQIALYFNAAADANGFFDLCLGSAQCGTAQGTIAPASLQIYGFYNNQTATSNPGMAATNFSSGYLAAGSEMVPATITPEPASLVLLGTGMLGVAGTIRRRLFNA